MTATLARIRIPEFPAEHEFRTVIVSNRDPLPPDTPKTPAPVMSLVKKLHAGGWDTMIGFSRAYRKGVKTGTYRIAEHFGVYAYGHDSSPYRITAIHWRFADKEQEFSWFRDTEAIEETVKACGEPAKWTWEDPRIILGFNRHRMKVTDIKEFASVRGSVLPGWFAAVAKRFAEQATTTRTTEGE